jgi:hypothetical protein
MAVAATRKVDKTDNIPPPLVTADQLTADFIHLIHEVAELENECRDCPNVAEDDEDLALITKAGAAIVRLGKRIEEIRNEQNRPFLDASGELNAFFKHGLGATLSTIKTDLEKVSTVYQRKKAQREQVRREAAAAEAQRLADEAKAKVTAAVHAGDVTTVTVAVTQANSLTAFAARANVAAAAPVSSMGAVKTDAGAASLVDNWTFDELDMNAIDLNELRGFIPQASIEQALRAFIKAGRREIRGARIFNDNKTRFRA